MDRLPTELLQKIFALCCLDERTGPALSLVSRRICAVSGPYRFQTVGLRGPTIISKFATHLQTVPPTLCLTRHLFIYADAPHNYVPPDHILLPDMPRPDPPDPESFQAWSRKWYAARVKWDKTWADTLDAHITTILTILGPTLVSLTLSTHTPVTLPPLPLAKLDSLTLKHTCPTLLAAPRLPALTRLHITHGTGTGLLTPSKLAALAPALTHLRFSSNGETDYLPTEVAAILGRPYPFRVVMNLGRPYSRAYYVPAPTPPPSLFPHLRQLLVHPRQGTAEDYMEPRRLFYNSLAPGILLLMAQDPQRRLVLLEANANGGGEYTKDDLEAHWRDWVEGGEGCWAFEDWRDEEGTWRDVWVDFEGF